MRRRRLCRREADMGSVSPAHIIHIRPALMDREGIWRTREAVLVERMARRSGARLQGARESLDKENGKKRRRRDRPRTSIDTLASH